jgi:SNF2 family DNA or RNA helicase
MSDIKLWAHQVEAIKRAKTARDMALFWEMGTGKTLAMIKIMEQQVEMYGSIQPTLVLCPSVVVPNWADEITKYSNKLGQPIPLSGPVKKRIDILRANRGSDRIFITNYESFNNAHFFMEAMRFGFKVLVYDESQRLKSHNSRRSKCCALLSNVANHRYILSGTPVLNSPMDLFQQFKVLDRGETFGKNFFIFRSTYFENKNANAPSHVKWPDWQLRPGALEEITKIVQQKSLRVTKDECLDLPERVFQTVYVDLSNEQKRMYKEMKNDFISFVKSAQDGEIPRAVIANQAATKMLRLQQIVSGFVKTEDGTNVRLKDVPRLKELSTLLEDLVPYHKVIVWCAFIENYAMLREVCEKLGVKYSEIHGEVLPSHKQKEIIAFRTDPSVRVCIANPAAGGTGINLTEASYSIYYSKTFNLEHDLQSQDRNYRGGSEMHEKVTRIDMLAKGTVDELIKEALKSKQTIADIILDTSLAELQDML